MRKFSMDRSKYIELCLERHEAVFKPEYLKSPETYAPYLIATGQELPPKPTFKTQSGQNKNRKANSQFSSARATTCQSFAASNFCSAGDECTRSHDLKAAMATESHPIPLAETCMTYEAHGICPNGVNCVFNPTLHLDSEGRNVKKDGSLVTPEDLVVCKEDTKNHSNDLIQKVKAAKLHLKPPRNTKRPSLETAAAESGAAESGASESSESAASTATESAASTATVGCVVTKEEKRSKLKSLLKGKVILAPLTTVGNMPFRRMCIRQGCEATMSEMVYAQGLMQLKKSDLALLRRHADEKIFGVQIAGGFPDQMQRAAEIITEAVDCDWVDINMGCPLDGLHGKGAGCILMTREARLQQVIEDMSRCLPRHPLTIKCRTGFSDKQPQVIHELIPRMFEWGVDGVTVHGRTARQRYLKESNWDYISSHCKPAVPEDGLFVGNGDLCGPDQIVKLWEQSQADSVMIGRGALIKPWIFQEIKRGQLYDISSSERFDMLKDYCKFGIELWGCDAKGIETTRRFLLEQLSFLHRYVPIGLLEEGYRTPKLNVRPPAYVGRNDLETLMGKGDISSWIELSEMLLGKAPEGFKFIPKHKSHAYEVDDEEVSVSDPVSV